MNFNLIWPLIILIICCFLFQYRYQVHINQMNSIQWMELNALIIKSEFSHRTFGNEKSYANKESQRRVKLTIQFNSSDFDSIVVTKPMWTYTKNRSLLQEKQSIAILYNKDKPTQFKLKYDL